MKKKSIILVVVLICVYGCSSSYVMNRTPVPVTETTAAEVTVPYSSTTSIITQITTVQPIPKFQPTITAPASTRQVEITEDVPVCQPSTPIKEAKISGQLLVQPYDGKGLFAVDVPLLQKMKTIVPTEEMALHVFGISQNGYWLAYSPISNGEDYTLQKVDPLIVLLGAGGEKIEHTVNMDWLKRVNHEDYALTRFINGSWLGSNLIFAYVNSNIPETPSPLQSPQIGLFLPVLIDPYSGSVQTNPLDLILSSSSLNGYSFSPDLKYVLSFDHGMSLKEITGPRSYRILWQAKTGMFSPTLAMSWSPDGNWAVFNSVADVTGNPFRTILISKDGRTVIELPYPLYSVAIKEYFWSPNSRFFAFIHQQDNQSFNLLVFDVENLQSVLECPFFMEHADSYPLDHLIWSPDNNWIAVSAKQESVKLVNIRSNEVKELELFGSVVGWSEQFAVNP